MNFYEHHIGDYAEATAHLSFVEDAAYSRLIRKYYANERPLPVEPRAVERLVGARTKEEREAVRTVLEEFFTLELDGWHNKRCDEELDRYHEKQAKARKSANARWKPTDSERTAPAMRTHQPSNANASEPHNGRNALQSPVPSPQSPEEISPSPQASCVITPTSGVGFERANARKVSEGEIRKPTDTFELVTAIKTLYPAGTYRASNWALAERAISKLLGDGESDAALTEAARAYAAQQAAKGSTGTQFVLSPEKFFGPDGHWRGPFPLPAQSTSPSGRRSVTDTIAELRKAAGDTP